MEKNKGFTLIELLAVIVILSVVAIISTPIVLNVVENAQRKADLGSANGLVDAGRLYYSESLLDETKKENLKNYRNLWDQIVIQGQKPKEGELYVSPNGLVALSVLYRERCYQKTFTTGIEILPKEECGLGFVGDDTNPPTVQFVALNNPFNESNWAREDFYVQIQVVDTESGPATYKWCTTVNDTCNPEIEHPSSTGTTFINQETSTNRVCVIGKDQNKNESEIICSDLYKLDKTKPSFSGIGDIFVKKDESVDLSTGVSANDSLSGVNDPYTYMPTLVDTSKAGITDITYTVVDYAGNMQEYIRKVIVETVAPTVIFTPESGKINARGWAKENFLVTITPNDQSGHGMKEFKWCSTTNSSCDPTGNTSLTIPTGAVTISVESASNRVCVIATDNTGVSSTNICSDAYKLDKTAPILNGIFDSNIVSGDLFNLIIGITTNDTLSGMEGSFSYSPLTINTDVAKTTEVTYRAFDQAGNETTKIRKVTVIASTNASYFTFDIPTKTITGYSNSGPKNVVIPTQINGVAVEIIGYNAFREKDLTSVIIPSGVTNIREYAFYKNKLTNATIPTSVINIGYAAFTTNLLPEEQAFIYQRKKDGSEDKTTLVSYGGAKRDNIIIPNSITTIGDRTFEDNQITGVTIPDSVTKIGAMAFYKNQLTSIVLPSGLTKLEYTVFQENKLTSVNIPNGVTIIEDQAFQLNQLTSVTLPNTVTSIGSWAFRGNILTNITLPASLKQIAGYAFYENKLTNITIPYGVTSIGEHAFTNNSITSITIPSTVTNIGGAAFNNNQLPTPTALVYARNSNGTIDNTKIVSYGGAERNNVIIPSNVKIIGGAALQSNAIKNVTIPYGVTTIESYALDANQLTYVIIPSSVVTIGNSSISRNSLTNVTIPASVMNIASEAFAYNQLTNVYIRGKAYSGQFTTYGNNIWGWKSGYSDSRISWNY